MKKTNKISRLVSLLISLAMIFTSIFALSPTASAATLAQQKANINSKISAAQKEIDQLEKEKASQKAIANKLQSQLSDLTSKVYVIQQQQDNIDTRVSSLTGEIKSLGNQIDETEKNLETMNNNISETVDLFCERMRANYMSGSASLLEIFLESGDLSSLLNRLEMFKRVTDNDQELVDKLNDEITEAESLKADLSEKKENAEIKKTELSAKKIELDASKAEYDDLIDDIEAKSAKVDEILYGVNSDIEELHDDIEGYKEAQADIVAAIKKAEAENKKNHSSSGNKNNSGSSSGGSSGGGGTSGTISKSGWMWPVPTGRSYISSGYGYRRDPATGKTKYHSGLDIAAPGGSNIVASKSGTVFYTKHNTTGYGIHLMINHGDGTYSLYGHCSGLAVSTGQHVRQGQVIAYVGQTGYATGNHCHFEIRDGAGNKYNPASYVHK